MDCEVVVVGSAMIDLTAYTEKMPLLGETVMGKSFEKNFGGKGANQAVQCQRLGVKTAFIGNVGSDTYGSEYITHFRNEGMDVTYFQVIENESSGIAAIWVDGKGNNSIIIIPGANKHVDSSKVPHYLEYYSQAKIIIFQNEINFTATSMGLSEARRRGIRSIYNPAPVTTECVDLLKICDILCVNEVELAILSEKTVDSEESIIEACTVLSAFGCTDIVVTFGSRGAYLFSGGQFSYFPAPKVAAIDTVGAGDSFIGCMAANLARSVALSDAITRAVNCASISVQSRGAQPSYAYLSDIPSLERPPLR